MIVNIGSSSLPLHALTCASPGTGRGACTRQPRPYTAAALISAWATVSSATSRSAAPSRMADREIWGVGWGRWGIDEQGLYDLIKRGG